MKFGNPFATLTKGEIALWLGSMAAITVSFIICLEFPIVEIIACYMGATMLIFVSKGHPFGHLMAIGFALCYAWVSIEFHYYGEMMTYLFMNTPISIISLIAWLRHPFRDGEAEVKVEHFGGWKWGLLVVLTAGVTTAFFFILQLMGTSNLLFSTISIATSFSACMLMIFRSPWYAVAYMGNDVVLIILWILASIEDFTYFPMIVCIFTFLVNDIYGFINWQRIKKRQSIEEAAQ